MWFVTRRRYNAEIAALHGQNEALRERCEAAETNERTERVARRTITRQHAELDAANRRLHDRNLELGRRLSQHMEADPDYAASLEQRVGRLRKAAARYLDAMWTARAEVRSLTDLAVQANTRLDDMAAKVKAAEERANATRTTPREKPTIDGAPNVRREASSARLRRAEARCAALQQRIDELQASHIADTRELHDLRQGVAS